MDKDNVDGDGLVAVRTATGKRFPADTPAHPVLTAIDAELIDLHHVMLDSFSFKAHVARNKRHRFTPHLKQ